MDKVADQTWGEVPAILYVDHSFEMKMREGKEERRNKQAEGKLYKDSSYSSLSQVLIWKRVVICGGGDDAG